MCHPHDFFEKKNILRKKGDEISPFDGIVLMENKLKGKELKKKSMEITVRKDGQA